MYSLAFIRILVQYNLSEEVLYTIFRQALRSSTSVTRQFAITLSECRASFHNGGVSAASKTKVYRDFCVHR